MRRRGRQPDRPRLHVDARKVEREAEARVKQAEAAASKKRKDVEFCVFVLLGMIVRAVLTGIRHAICAIRRGICSTHVNKPRVRGPPLCVRVSGVREK